MNTNYPKAFPRASLLALLACAPLTSKEKRLPTIAEFVEINRHATFALGCLVTCYKNVLPGNLDSVKAPPKPLQELVALMLEKNAIAEAHPGVLSADEIVYCVAFCQSVLSDFSQWKEPAPPTPPTPVTPPAS